MTEPDFLDRLLARCLPGAGLPTDATPVRPRLNQLFEPSVLAAAEPDPAEPPRATTPAVAGPGSPAAAPRAVPPPAAAPVAESVPVHSPTAGPPVTASAGAEPVSTPALLPVRTVVEPGCQQNRSVNETITERRIPVTAALPHGPADVESPAASVGPAAPPRPGPRPQAAVTPRRRRAVEPAPPSVTVSIGRLEVTATAPDPLARQRDRPSRTEPALGLAEYLGGDR
ncbi:MULTISPECIES: hypothetical protein [unclassified Crossiella]|uniref:hypothetical protein n=1 Tax=unclassified Crossiella TaxID=2620835 RepID=UPI001FFF6DBA|nr:MULTISPECIES: hypothetical protein [unclassified Crossiella]MCK2242400.1 hypothetical protein [Crossiella sp. S99.2]MCK2254569.1 hypothetical protein [Crossiella sp. S99.1]